MAPNQHFTNGFQSTTTVSDITLIERNKEVALEETHDDEYLPIVSEVENAKCECCGMCEECTREYIRRVRDMFSGRLICGLCAEAVSVEMEKNGGKREKAVKEHMSDCVKFNRLGRSYPALYLAEDVKEILKKTQKKGHVKAGAQGR
ncbi:hypothetical protein AAZX31_06G083100 [Glycine max]|uniref:Uncharacterized protein n=2 Tax=Glycine subgen. Soja TaxID=1462606 RepID=K7KTY9_SOYBN|nr:uncharacterized protein LOC100778170 [Glycine max]XP_028234336.1 uncharacterized protein LOC114414231 [Glycine soja]KAH1245022.1 hypothetical protein GmHk_06G015471 [Glycine max]KHN18155.1 hypothetical protein glysoja_025045 [Glycine soja]RZC06498.1 hypothetical protein D0Y65_014138 [Glycine soja]|eukprot:XP_003527846.1 uncharacterized protein LOC100778170 [Glycine max]